MSRMAYRGAKIAECKAVPGEILIAEPEVKSGSRKANLSEAVAPWDGRSAARASGWIGALLLSAALIDYTLALYPSAFGNPEWETGTISQLVAGLPLVTIGLAGLWASGAGLARRWLLRLLGVVFLAAAVAVIAMLILFSTNIPTALRATEGVSHLGILKLVAKTLTTGLMFSVAYVMMGVLSLRQSRGIPSTGAVR